MPSTSEQPRRPGAYAVSSESKGPPQHFHIQVPPNTEPGGSMTFTAGTRTGLSARCPPTCQPGDVLQIAILPEPETHHVGLKMAVLTSGQDKAGGGAKKMREEVRQANKEILESAASSFLVVVPANVTPGMHFVARTPQGQKLLVTCPENAGPNQQIRILPPSNDEPAQEFSSTQTQTFEVVAPEGVRPNQVLPVLVCGKRIPVTLPPNVFPGQKLKLKLPIQKVVGSIELSYDDKASTGWCRTIRMSDLKFQWIRVDNNSNEKDTAGTWQSTKTAFVRKIVFLQGNDARMRSGSVEFIPADQSVVESELVNQNQTLVSYASVAHIQGRSLDEKTTWFQNICTKLTVPWEAGRIKIVIRRQHLIRDSLYAIMSLSRTDMRKRWRIEFVGEPAIDSGGVMREWFQLVTEQVFNPDFGLWLSSVNNQICMRINPASDISCPDEHLIFFRFIGRIMGRALFDRQLIHGHLVRHLYKHLLGWPITFEDLEAQDEEYYQSLKKFTTMDDLSVMCLDFTITEDILGVRKDIDLVPGGSKIEVTKENLSQYLQAILKYRMLDRTKVQITELLLGFFDVIPEPALTVFDPSELELMLCGVPTIDMEDWESNTIYSGNYKEKEGSHQVVQWFWNVVRDDFDQEMKARLLQFVTGTSGVPSRGFSVLQGNDGNIKKFAIHGVDRSAYHYPRAHTCFNRLDLPDYTSREELHDKLKAAITLSATGFDIE